MSAEKVCQGNGTLIFACSGAADVGAIADQAARKLTQEGEGQMFCLAGVGGRIDPIMQKTQAASTILAIDGCALDCTRKTLEVAGCTNVKHFRLTDLGMEKGKSSPTQERIELVVTQGKAMLS